MPRLRRRTSANPTREGDDIRPVSKRLYRTASPCTGSWSNKFPPSFSLPTLTEESAKPTLALKSKWPLVFLKRSGWKTPFNGIGKSTRRTKIGGVWMRPKCLLPAKLFDLHTELLHGSEGWSGLNAK